MNKAIAAAAAVLFASCAANAQETSSIDTIEYGDDLLAACTAEGESEQALCMAWIGGFLAGVLGASELSGTHVLCVPPDNEQVRDVLVAYLREHPGDRRGPQALAGQAMAALYQEFPCVD